MAIARDATSEGSTTATSLTVAHTCTGSNRLLLVHILTNNTTDTLTGMTYNGVAMTRLGIHASTPNNFIAYVYGLLAPATGSNNVVVTFSGSTVIGLQNVSYTGVKQSGLPDASNSNNDDDGNDWSESITTIANNCWHFLGKRSGSDATVTSGGVRVLHGNYGGVQMVADSDAAITPAGSHAIAGSNAANGYTSINVSIAPYLAALIGPSNGAAVGVTATPGSMALSWTDNDSDETSFSVERSNDGATGWTEVLTPAANATSATDTGLTADTVYYYRMRSYRSADSSYSSYTSVFNGRTCPATPTGAAAVGVDATSNIRITWTDNAVSETSYEVERSDDGASGWSTVASGLAPNTITYDNSVGTASTTKYYRVRAVRSGIGSAYSSVVNGKTAPAAPSSCAVAPVTASYTLRVTWADNSSDESGFSIERSNNGSSGWAEVGTVGAGVVTYDDTSIGAGDTVRYYRVRALRASDGVDSAYSNTDNDTTAPQAPSGLAVAFSNLLATVSWTDNSTTNTSYLLERKRESAAYATVSSGITANAVSYADTTVLDVNHTYTYRLSAYRSGDSMYSPVATVSAPVPPEEPTNLQAFPKSDVTGNISVQLLWDKNARYDTGTKVERSTNGSSWSTVATTAKGATTYEDTGLTVNTLYYYRVSAVGSVATSTTVGTTVTTKLNTVAGMSYSFLKKVRSFPRE